MTDTTKQNTLPAEAIDQERAAFHEFAKAHGLHVYRSPAGETAYSSAITRCAWLAWQAAIAARATPVSPAPDLHSAETIDTPEFCKYVGDVVKASHGFNDSAAALQALITHIMDWHSARMAAARQDGDKARQVAVGIAEGFWKHWQERAEKAEAALAAAREQALPTNDQVYEEVCRERGASMLYVSTNAVNDVMAAVRRLSTAPVPAPATVPSEDIADAVADLRKACIEGASDEWIVGFVRQYPFKAPATKPEAVATVVPDERFDQFRQALEIIGVGDSPDPRRTATEVLVSTGFWKQEALAAPAAVPKGVDIPFPERDATKPAEQQGMFRKFDVRRVDGSDQPGGKHHGCRYFVLDLNHDQHAPAAMRAYAAACVETHPQLAADINAEFPAPVAVAPVESAGASSVAGLDKLHSAIMNLPCNHNEPMTYKIGHRDARHAAAERVSAALAERQPQPTLNLPKVCDGKEQGEFERWASNERYEMTMHPLHWLFLNESTAAARDGWKAALSYVERVAAIQQDQQAGKDGA